MTSADDDYVQEMVRQQLIGSPCLELGAGYAGPTSQSRLSGSGLTYVGTDLHAGPGVDLVADFEASEESVLSRVGERRFSSVLVLNVLEHTFEPLRVLDNIKAVLEPGGTIVAIAPAVWPLHSFPQDCYRFNPDFYRRYAATRRFEIVPGTFRYLGFGAIGLDAPEQLPNPGRSPWAARYSRVVHRVFNTFGRGMFFPAHVAIGVVLRMQAHQGRRSR
jgi:SAM-dependent methyltransferase